ncbi:MAG: carbohydrate ABC transporter permease [Candidatus Eisenbacteria bacterium]|uniref:Carbohydrate ABC transporter permease n=1 Tax=Eiseniibacteriota bacterium TaxID=2212470 RepID=A0A849SJN6_UNCEI|nr:carbohydrate ABC transporter permease [Candidatus Eisenbacteria bacterium]
MSAAQEARESGIRQVAALPRWLWLGPLLLTMLMPFGWMLLVSLSRGASGSFGSALAGPFGWEHYRALFGAASVHRYLANSALVAAAVVTLNVMTAAMVGWVLGRRRVPGERFWTLGIVATLMLPKQVLMIPLYLVLARLHLLDTYGALILPFAVDAFSIFLVRQYVAGLPLELEEAARVDGASDWTIFRRVILPLLKPVLAVIAIQSFLTNWNSFLFPLIFVDSERLRTLPVGLALLAQGEHSVDWGLLMAGSTVASLPVLAVFVVFQRRILAGMLAGAEK